MAKASDRFKLAVATAFGLGLAPVAPGSFGALLGVGLHLLIAFTLPAALQIPALVLALALVALANHWLTPWAVRYWNDKDPGHFVLDEVAGYLLVPILFRPGEPWQVALWGFLLFRILDIIKVPPARQVDQKLHGSWGILLDDLISALYAVAVLYGLRWLSLRYGFESWLIAS